MLMLVLLMFLMALAFLLSVTPFPVVVLIPGIQLAVVHVIVAAVGQPLPVCRFFLRIPVVIIAILRIVHSALMFLSFVPFMVPVVLRSRDCHRPYGQH